MLISYKWLNEYVDLSDLTPDELADKMSRTGIEVEEVIRPDAGLKKIVVGEVVDCVDHPNSDHLHICQVNIGDEVTQIVCGAPNVKTGQKVIVALPGARIAGNHKIKKSKMRGEASNGMLCALEEIGISSSVTPKEYEDGIYILPADAIPGESVFPILGMDDALIDLAITPNRADALSMRGTAYEVAAIYQKDLQMTDRVVEEGDKATAEMVTATVENTDAAPVYTLRYLDNVTVKPSPMWLQTRLMNMGIRPINNIVDITNYMMLEYGEPMHAYDAGKLDLQNISVRQAKEEERLVTLDGEERTLSSEDIVIASADQAIALAGVMGGKETEVTDQTTAIVLEAGQFDPISIRRTSQRHNLRTDASARFEKGINMAAIKEASNAAADMMRELAGATVYRDLLVASDTKPQEVVLSITKDRINGLLGTDLSVDAIQSYFEALRFETSVAGDTLTVTIPPRRWDITIEADLVEEVGRLFGYDNLPSTLPTGAATAGALSKKQAFIRRTKSLLAGLGLQEVISYALTTADKASQFTLADQDTVSVDLPMSEEHAVLRQSIAQGLMEDIHYNVARKNQDLALFETGTVFAATGHNQLPEERQHLGIALTGEWQSSSWNQAAKPADFFVLKGIVETLLQNEGINAEFVATQMDHMHPGRTAEIVVDGKIIGFLGQIHPQYEKDYQLPVVFVAELDLDAMLSLEKTSVHAQPVSKYPAVTRDMALLVNEDVTNAALEDCIYQNGGRFLTQVKLFDLYAGENIESGKKSMAYQLNFVNPEATLTDEDIDKAMAKISRQLMENFELVIR